MGRHGEGVLDSVFDMFDGYSQDKYIPSLAFINDEVNKITHAVESHFASVAASMNEALRTTPWLPNSIKPPQRPSPPPPPVGLLKYSQDWISRHRALTAAIVAFVGTGAFVIIWRRRRRSNGARKRANRAKNGCRTEVVVLAGSPYSPLTRSLSKHLERRGFIVYIPVADISEEEMVRSESRYDIRPLNLDITSPTATVSTMANFAEILARIRTPLPDASSHSLHLAAFLVLPPTPPPTDPISSIPPGSWSDTLTTQLLAPFATLYAFLPLLTTHQSSLLFLTPTIIPSLTPASHGLENVVAGGMQGYIDTLRKEVAATDIHIVQLKLGTFDFDLAPMSRALVPAQDIGREESAAGKVAREDGAAVAGIGPAVKGSPLRDLHRGVFDAIISERGRSGTMFLGRGSRTYDYVSRWVPAGVVGWMLKGVGENKEQEQRWRRRSWEQQVAEDDKVRVGSGGSNVEWQRVERGKGVRAGGD